MNEEVPQELKEAAEKVLRKASRDVYELLALAENVVEKVSDQLDEWADALASGDAEGGGTQISTQDMYQYLLDNGTEWEKSIYGEELVRHHLIVDNPELLKSIYESKKASADEEFTDIWRRFSES